MNNFSVIGDNFKKYLTFKGIGVNQSAKILEFSGSQVSNIINGKVFGADKLFKILNVFSDLNPEWLFTGEGEMLKNNISVLQEPTAVYKLKTDRLHHNQVIPLYDLEASAGLVSLFNDGKNLKPIDYIQIPYLPKCDGAIYVTGDSMYPLLKSGDIVMYKEVPEVLNGIIWGEMYIINYLHGGNDMVSVKWIKKSEKGEAFIKLVSQNQHHQDLDIEVKNIRALALVKASIRINSMI